MKTPPESMTDRPEHSLGWSRTADQSDVLSHLLTLIRLRGELVYSAELAGSFAGGFAPGPSHLLFVEHGSVWLTLDGLEPVLLKAGDLVLLPHGKGHMIADRATGRATTSDLLGSLAFDTERLVVRVGSGPRSRARCIGATFRFEEHPLPPVVTGLPMMIHIRDDGGKVPDWLQHMVHFLMLEAREPRPGSALMISRTIDLLVIRTLRSWADLYPDEAGWLGGLGDARIWRVLNALHARPAIHWTLASLAELAGMSRSAFAERFSALVGEAPMRYLTRWRLTVADQLISAGAAVGTAGREAGYQSDAGFSRAYKAHFGQSPKIAKLG
jgi:AraC-like DNA-binding protein